jgi:membrane-bound lytic murein transglycosylase B
VRAVRLAALLLCVARLATAGEPPPVTPLKVTAVGDVNLGTDFPSTDYLPPDGGAGLLSPVHELLQGDVVFGNLEGPLADGGESAKCGPASRNCFAFRTPTAYGKWLKAAGFNVLSLANNHALDFGAEGRESTVRVLDGLGIAHSGAPGSVARLEVRGRRIALVAFTTSEHSNNLLEVEAAARFVAELVAAGDLVIVSFHGGSEGSGAGRVPDGPEFLGREPRGHLVQFAHAVVDAGAALVLGHGPHVMRGLEIYRGRLVAYSLGNFCTYGRFSLGGPLGRAGVLQVELEPETGAFLGGRLAATWQEKPGGAKPDPSGESVRTVRELSWADFPYTAPAIEDDGTLGPGPGLGAGLFTLPSAEARGRLRELLGELERRGFQRAELARWFGDPRGALAPRVVEKFARPLEKTMTYERYRQIFLQPDRLEAGRKWLEEHRALLDRVEADFKVDRTALAGVIATETKFGQAAFPFRAFDALVTQCLEIPRRKKWATDQLVALLRVFQEDPLRPMGSYAGAVGLVQFMPTSIQRFGVDGDGDGRIDLEGWPDAVASAASYLKGHGWKLGQPLVPGGPNAKALWGYNPSSHYVKVVTELSEAFGHPKPPAPAKGKKPPPEKKPPEKKPDGPDPSGEKKGA